MQRKCISAVLWQNPIKHSLNVHPNVFDSFYRTVTHGEPPQGEGSMGFAQAGLPQHSNAVSPHFTIEALPSVASQFSFIRTLQIPLQKIHNISVGHEKPPYMLFFCFKPIEPLGSGCQLLRVICWSLIFDIIYSS